MKKHIIFIAIAAIISIVVLGIPQLTGTVFVNNPEEKKPVDWLSAQVMKFGKENNEKQHDIPAHIRHIKIGGAENHGRIYVLHNSKPHIRYHGHNDYFNLKISIDKDTMIIANGASLPALSLYIDSNITKLTFSNTKDAEVHINHTLPLDLTVENQSDINLRGNRNTSLKQIDVSGQSTFTLGHCFTPVIDMQVDNSMVYVERFNHIDSLKAHLIGKSNIKRIHTAVIDTNEEILLKEFNVISQHIFIYPTGNLKYYNLSKSH